MYVYSVTCHRILFLRNILLENNSPFEEHSVIYSQIFRCVVKFSIGTTELIKESSHFLKSVTVILMWLLHIVTKILKSQYVKKVTFHYSLWGIV
jgi:hypothetical protein